MKAFECLIVFEKGTMPYINGDNDEIYLWPELKTVTRTEIAVDSIPFEEANDKIMELAKEAVHWTEDDGWPFIYYERESAYEHSDVYVIGSWLPGNHVVYRRFYRFFKSTGRIIEKTGP